MGLQDSAVGFAAVNGRFHRLTGVHWLTDIVGGVLLSGGLARLCLALGHRKEQSYDRKICIPAGHCGGDPGGI